MTTIPVLKIPVGSTHIYHAYSQIFQYLSTCQLHTTVTLTHKEQGQTIYKRN